MKIEVLANAQLSRGSRRGGLAGLTREYTEEIKNYWREQYDGEVEVDDTTVLIGKVPIETCELKGFIYSLRDCEDGSVYYQMVLYRDDASPEVVYLKKYHKVQEFTALFVSSATLPSKPPYSLTGQNLINSISNRNDFAQFKHFINQNGKGYVFFPLGLDYAIGGVYIGKLVVNRKGYRTGVLRPFKVLTDFENKTKKLDRLLTSVYNDDRVATRTAGKLMEMRKFVIAGLGSIGSNLCYYLNGYNNAEFALIDGDRLSTDNIGRHLLGFDYLNQRKAFAVARYLKAYRPDRKVTSFKKRIQEFSEEAINEGDVLFLCTGDLMSEKWLLDKLRNKTLTVPAFILWLEPYGVSGIMVYVNPSEQDNIETLVEKGNDSFQDYCLIDRREYETEQKLTQRDAGCDGKYALYSANDVTLFLSAMFSHIDRLLNRPEETQIYRWVGNIEIANQKGILLKANAEGLSKNEVTRLDIQEE